MRYLREQGRAPNPCILIIITLASACYGQSLSSHSQGLETLHADEKAQPYPASRQIAEKAYHWLICQQEPRTGLVRSNSIPGSTRRWKHDARMHISNVGWTYDQALAIITFLIVNEEGAAKRCANGMLKIRHPMKKAWSDGYNVCTGKVEAEPIAAGPNAWMGLALLHLFEKTKEPKYLLAAEEIGEFILALQSDEGRIWDFVPGGYEVPESDKDEKKLFNWTSTEHNADSLAFFTALATFNCKDKEKYRNAAVRIADWLNREMWNKKDKYYYPGYGDNRQACISTFPELLDSQTWTILAIHGAREWNRSLGERMELLLEDLPDIVSKTCEVTWQGKELIGFPKITHGRCATSSIWAEGTAGYILAARRVKHKGSNLLDFFNSLCSMQQGDGSVPYSVGISYPDVTKEFKDKDIIVADFEAHPNRFRGNVGVYGDAIPDWDTIGELERRGYCNLEPNRVATDKPEWQDYCDPEFAVAAVNEPYSWYYEPETLGYGLANVHSGRQSFRLVNAGDMCKYKKQGWATLGLDLGPIVGCTTPDSIDVSGYKQLSFWAKKENTEHAKLEVIFQDRHRRSYNVQAVPRLIEEKRGWQKFAVDLDQVRQVTDLEHVTNVGLSFGTDVGNNPNTVIYVDDVAFTGSRVPTDPSNGDHMPPAFPNHWPDGSIAGTAWLVFVELDINPFAPLPVGPSVSARQCTSRGRDDTCWQFSLPCFALRDWIGLSANLDTSYRRTQFYKRGDDARVFQGDGRIDLWLPPFRDEFSWGPYVRFSGVASNTDYEWENNWGARPGVGFQIYPFSSRKLKEECELYSDLAELLGPLHAFAEHDEVHYSGREHSWRPDELVRMGVDYWNEWHVDDTRERLWAETWHGLIWHSTNGFDKDYDTLIFANSLRMGIRKPNAGVASMFTPYLAAESSLSENGDYFWENRLLLGGGVRFAPPLKFLPPEWNMTRFVVYAEYLNAAAYYRSSAPSSVPDEDFRVGINVYIGEWWHR